jgi:lysophospholipase L1-like esterase
MVKILGLSLVLLTGVAAGEAPSATSGTALTPAMQRLSTQQPMHKPLWQQLHAAHIERARQGGIHLLCIGDSITRFWEAEGRQPWQQMLLPRGAALFAVPGDTTASVLARLPIELAALKEAPEQVVLLLGANNVITPPNRADGHDIAYAIGRVIALLHERLPTARLTVVSVLPRRGQPNHVAVNTRQLNNDLAAAATASHYRFLDIHDAFLAAGSATQADARWLKDEVHLNADGYARYAERLLPVLDAKP